MASKQVSLPDNRDEILYVKNLQKGGLIYCGYRREYLARNLSKMEEGFVTCSVCTGITRKATLYRGETTCLVCSVSQTEINPVRLVQNAVSRLEIKCPLLRECTWNGILSEAEGHLDNCTQFLIPCEVCEVLVERGQCDYHRTFLCLLREVECKHCGKEELYEDLEQHFKFCLEYPIPCSNGCGVFLNRNQLSQHKSICLLEVITCPYNKYGCNAVPMLRRELLAHKKEFYIEHQDMSLNEIQELNEEISQLHKEKHDLYCEGKEMLQLDGVEWEIQNVNDLKERHEITGPTFYVRDYALKIYLIVIHHEVYGVTFGFTLRRVKGQFDTKLGKASITTYRIVLVNQSDVTESYASQGEVNYDLTVGKYSGILEFGTITWIEYYSCLTEEKSMLMRLYFEVNSSKPIFKMISHQLVYEGDFGSSILPNTFHNLD